MAPRDVDKNSKPKRSRKKKSRTADVSSPSSSENESTPEPVKPKSKKLKTKHEKPVTTATIPTTSTSPSPPPVRQIKDSEAEEAFTSFYLRQLTMNFAEDLDKIRSASDFRNNSVALLIDSLKQGSACFQRDERIGIGRAVLSRDE